MTNSKSFEFQQNRIITPEGTIVGDSFPHLQELLTWASIVIMSCNQNPEVNLLPGGWVRLSFSNHEDVVYFNKILHKDWLSDLI